MAVAGGLLRPQRRRRRQAADRPGRPCDLERPQAPDVGAARARRTGRVSPTPMPAAAASSARASRCRSTAPTRRRRRSPCRSPLEADPAAPRGVLLALNGGPGAAGRAAGAGARRAVGPEVVAAYRVVALDQRGTGPTALECPALQQDGATRFVPVGRRGARVRRDARRRPRPLRHRRHGGRPRPAARGRSAPSGCRCSRSATAPSSRSSTPWRTRRGTELLVLDSALPAGGIDTLQRDVVPGHAAGAAAGLPGRPLPGRPGG